MDEDAGFITAPVPADAVGVFKKAVRQVDENVTLARTVNLLFHYTGNARHREMAGHAMRYLAAPALLESRRLLPGVLITAHELSEEPLHITVVGKRRDASARVLYAEALRWPAVFKRIEWWDRSEGPLPNPDVQYPQIDKAAISRTVRRHDGGRRGCPEGVTAAPRGVFPPKTYLKRGLPKDQRRHTAAHHPGRLAGGASVKERTG